MILCKGAKYIYYSSTFTLVLLHISARTSGEQLLLSFKIMADAQSVDWQRSTVSSPHIDGAINVIVARNIPYVQGANKLQNLSIYVPDVPENTHLIGSSPTTIPHHKRSSKTPQWHVHIHGGAWRDPNLSSTSIEAAVAHAFSSPDQPITAIASINYTLSPFPTHPKQPYDPWGKTGSTGQPDREAQHPAHIQDVLRAFSLLRTLGLTDDSYILTGHSCGACLAFQATLFPPSHWDARLNDVTDAPPKPAALCGFNGLYDLIDLVHGLGTSHAHLGPVYKDLEDIAFGSDEGKWAAASPARVDPAVLSKGVAEGHVAKLVLVDQSAEDQLVPMNEADKMESVLRKVKGMEVVRGKRCTGLHAVPWEQGVMIWKSVLDVLYLLETES